MDATEILEKLKDYDFGAVEIDQLHLSQRRAARDVTLHVALVLHRLDLCTTFKTYYLLLVVFSSSKKGYIITFYNAFYKRPTYINYFSFFSVRM